MEQPGSSTSPQVYLGTLLSTLKKSRPPSSLLARQPPRLICNELVTAASLAAAASGSGTVDVVLRLSQRVLTHVRHSVWGSPRPASQEDTMNGRVARVIRALFTPNIVYYDGSTPFEFDPSSASGELDVSRPACCVAVNLGNPVQADLEGLAVWDELHRHVRAPLPPRLAPTPQRDYAPVNEQVVRQVLAGDGDDVAVSLQTDLIKVQPDGAAEGVAGAQSFIDVAHGSLRVGEVLVRLDAASLPLSSRHGGRPFRLSWRLRFSDEAAGDVEEVFSRTFDVIPPRVYESGAPAARRGDPGSPTSARSSDGSRLISPTTTMPTEPPQAGPAIDGLSPPERLPLTIRPEYMWSGVPLAHLARLPRAGVGLFLPLAHGLRRPGALPRELSFPKPAAAGGGESPLAVVAPSACKPPLYLSVVALLPSRAPLLPPGAGINIAEIMPSVRPLLIAVPIPHDKLAKQQRFHANLQQAMAAGGGPANTPGPSLVGPPFLPPPAAASASAGAGAAGGNDPPGGGGPFDLTDGQRRSAVGSKRARPVEEPPACDYTSAGSSDDEGAEGGTRGASRSSRGHSAPLIARLAMQKDAAAGEAASGGGKAAPGEVDQGAPGGYESGYAAIYQAAPAPMLLPPPPAHAVPHLPRIGRPPAQPQFLNFAPPPGGGEPVGAFRGGQAFLSVAPDASSSSSSTSTSSSAFVPAPPSSSMGPPSTAYGHAPAAAPQGYRRGDLDHVPSGRMRGGGAPAYASRDQGRDRESGDFVYPALGSQQQQAASGTPVLPPTPPFYYQSLPTHMHVFVDPSQLPQRSRPGLRSGGMGGGPGDRTRETDEEAVKAAEAAAVAAAAAAATAAKLYRTKSRPAAAAPTPASSSAELVGAGQSSSQLGGDVDGAGAASTSGAPATSAAAGDGATSQPQSHHRHQQHQQQQVGMDVLAALASMDASPHAAAGAAAKAAAAAAAAATEAAAAAAGLHAGESVKRPRGRPPKNPIMHARKKAEAAARLAQAQAAISTMLASQAGGEGFDEYGGEGDDEDMGAWDNDGEEGPGEEQPASGSAAAAATS